MNNILFSLLIFVCCLGCNSKNGSNNEAAIPEYTVLSSVDLYTGKGKCGEILMPSVSRGVSKSDREKILKAIMKEKGWVIISAYVNKNAYSEKSCAPYSKRSKSFKEGYLGKINGDGEFSD